MGICSVNEPAYRLFAPKGTVIFWTLTGSFLPFFQPPTHGAHSWFNVSHPLAKQVEQPHFLVRWVLKSAPRRREYRRKGQPIAGSEPLDWFSFITNSHPLRHKCKARSLSLGCQGRTLCRGSWQAGPRYLCWLCCWPLSEGQSRQLGAVARFVIVCQSLSSLCDPSCWARDSLWRIHLAFLLHWSKTIWQKSTRSRSSFCIRESLTEWLSVLSPCLLFGNQDQGMTCFLFSGKID